MTSPTAGSQRAADADNAEAFDELAKDEETEATLWDPDEGPATAPDLGIFALCLALCAAGCATAASCRGHPGADAWSRKLVILFTADSPARAWSRRSRARSAAVSPPPTTPSWAYAQSIEEMLAFAARTIERRTDFDGLPLPSTLAEARRVHVAGTPEQLPG
jgi:hypothetical protein